MLERFYPLLTEIVAPLARLYLLKRARKQPAYRDHWDERFGKNTYPTPFEGHPRLWLHAVSVGETQAARTLIEHFLSADVNAELLLTSMTPTGRDVGAKIAAKYPGRITQCYLPYDTPRLMGKFLDETQPKLGLIMETEVWPNLMRAVEKRKIPVFLVNARESEKSRRQAARFDALMRPAFQAFDEVLAQSKEDKERLESLGARNVSVCGSVKFDVRPDQEQTQKALKMKANVPRPILLIASTRQGEEAEFVREFSKLPKNVLVWLVPRHPQRFDEIAQLLESHQISYARKSMCKTDKALLENALASQVILADTMGEMSFNCALGDVCIMGGSFGNFGCQNLIEPAASGVPVIVGPSSFNFAKPVDDAVKGKAACRVANAREAIEKAIEWLGDGKAKERKEAALNFAQSYTGATEKMMKRILLAWKKYE